MIWLSQLFLWYIILHLARMESKRLELIECILSSSIASAVRVVNKGSEALLNAGFRSPLSAGIGISMYSLNNKDAFRRSTRYICSLQSGRIQQY